MREVAEEAGVSIKTVSRVVNKQGELADDTRQRVLTAIDKLGYRPSKVARALVTQRTETIGLLIGDIANPYFSEVASGVLDVAQEHEYDVFLCNTDGQPDTEKRALHSLVDHNVDGAVLYPTWDNKEWLPEYARQSCPLVLVNSRIEPRIGVSLVHTEVNKGASLAVNYLIEQGHQHIGMIAGQVGPIDRIHRVSGYRQALEANGREYRDDWVILGPPILEHGMAAAKEFYVKHPEVTALFCYNDLLAMGAIHTFKELGVKVPEDVAVIGFDNIRFSAMTSPALTTVHVDKYQIGKLAASTLLQMLKNPDKTYPVQNVDIELIVRESA
jgi:LacI family transcriptional regulator